MVLDKTNVMMEYSYLEVGKEWLEDYLVLSKSFFGVECQGQNHKRLTLHATGMQKARRKEEIAVLFLD